MSTKLAVIMMAVCSALFLYFKAGKRETSLLCRLQAETLPDVIPIMGQIHPFNKIALTSEQIMEL